MVSKKQDRCPARTVRDLEQRHSFRKRFAEIEKTAEENQKAITKSETAILLKIQGIDQRLDSMQDSINSIK